jgi:tRNA-dihydrouridine synthase
MLDETGCAGVSIGRGAFYDPWIFKRTRHYLRAGGFESASLAPRGTSGARVERAVAVSNGFGSQDGLLPELTFEERVRVMTRHLDLMVEVFGEESGCRMFRKVAPWYSRRFGPASEFNKRVTRISSVTDFRAVLEHYLAWRRQFLDKQGELLPRFRPGPLVASFMEPSAGDQGPRIPVPKGPVEVW